MGAPKTPNNVTSTFFNTVHLLPKDLGFEHGGAKLAFCPGPNLTSLRPWQDSPTKKLFKVKLGGWFLIGTICLTKKIHHRLGIFGISRVHPDYYDILQKK